MEITKDKVQQILNNAPVGADKKKIIEALISKGHTVEGLSVAKPKQAPQTEGVLPDVLGGVAETAEDVVQAGIGAGRELGKAGEQIVATAENKDLGLFDKVVQAGAQAFRGGSRAFGEVFKGAIKTQVPQSVETNLGKDIKATGEVVAAQPIVKDLVDRYNALDPEVKRNVDNALGYAEGLADILTAGTAKAIAKPLESALNTVAKETGELTKTMFTRPSKSIEEVIQQADTATAKTKQAAEAGAPATSISEKWVGISPDIKKRITGKQDKLQEYFDVAHARNADDTLPTVNEYGANKAQEAVQSMETILNDTGGKIGQTREKLGTYEANIDQLNKIETNFTNQLDKLNLELRNGVIKQKAGTVSRAGAGDITVLNGLYKDLLAVKQSPKLTNLIDLRDAFDARINFAKQAREASNEIDPLSRQVRADIADTAAQIVGPQQAAEVKKFSDFMEAYRDLKSYTDRKAGGEYLLRLVLSGRGGEARQILQTIKEYTGKDLLDDATMMLIANDVVANTRQQGLFRQELTKAGLDVAALTRGDARGVFDLLSNVAQKVLLDQEKVYLKAAK